MVAVNSSNLIDVEYDSDTMILKVTFNSWASFEYYKVPEIRYSWL